MNTVIKIPWAKSVDENSFIFTMQLKAKNIIVRVAMSN